MSLISIAILVVGIPAQRGGPHQLLMMDNEDDTGNNNCHLAPCHFVIGDSSPGSDCGSGIA
jgi:hypothetical protein